ADESGLNHSPDAFLSPRPRPTVAAARWIFDHCLKSLSGPTLPILAWRQVGSRLGYTDCAANVLGLAAFLRGFGHRTTRASRNRPTSRCRFAVLRGRLLDVGLIVPGRRMERDVEPVPTVNRDNHQSKLGQFSFAEFLAGRIVHGVRNFLVLKSSHRLCPCQS